MPTPLRKSLFPLAAFSTLAVAGLLRLTSPALATRAVVMAPVAMSEAAFVVVAAVEPARPVGLADLAERDPMGLARMGLKRYERLVRDYRCVFHKQERIGGKLRAEEQIEVRFREQPHSVYMIWQKNADKVKRALFIDSPKNTDKKGRKLATVEPAGAVIRIFVKETRIPIHGKDARKASRRTIDEFGFKAVFNLLDRFNRLGAENGVLEFTFGGEGEVDGRPTFILIRHLPYDGPTGTYPDAMMVLHIDQEWLLPTAVHSYSDHEGRELLGSYVFTDVELNPGLDDADFKF